MGRTSLGFSHLEPFSTYFHDVNIAACEGGDLVFAAPEERYQRVKHYSGYPAGALAALERTTDWGLRSADVVAIVARQQLDDSGRPLAQITNAAAGSAPFEPLAAALKISGEVFHCDHQLAHASAAFRLSPFDEATIVSLDGMGHDRGQACFGGVFEGRGNEVRCVDLCVSDGNSSGLFYGFVTEALGWKISDGEGKTMALATSGDPAVLFDDLLPYAPRPSGRVLSGGACFRPRSVVVNGQHQVFEPYVAELRELADRAGRENLAAAAQAILEDTVTGWLRNVLAATESKQVCLGGGVFLNVSLNSRLRQEFPDHDFFVPPAPADSGIAAGAALEAAARAGEPRPTRDRIQFLGPRWNRGAIRSAIDEAGGKVRVRAVDDVPAAVADLLIEGQVIGLFNGRSEWGPRALGNRSVLAHPGEMATRDRINRLLKRREAFMPFAPVVLAERLGEWFEDAAPSPFMKFRYHTKPGLADRIRAVLHGDDTGRAQTLVRDDHPTLYAVIEAFAGKTGLPMVLNTSFNLHGLPIVESPRDAVDHLLWGCVDGLLMDDLIVHPG